ncbi:hypothetical protein BSL82_02445 [Tardibacter chloracetimidivorans]|uniref:Uncharacterized protein n=1 Tax=Tardibacter chloracetimidivorans TaxID=1921510 RepID=A0A1L3ZRQ3_9SPHN|nr:hypothetical protein [Tardibacter chloracetimidivorans]API58307.1 hypothetical protein BSL82_02445 [Tardibacter chloracetimidivorans]
MSLLDSFGYVRSECRILESVGYERKIKALVREVERRRRVYPAIVESGKASQADVDEEIAAMEAILSDYWDKLLTIQIGGAAQELERRRRCLDAGIDPLTFQEPQEKAA